ncbi:zinc-ribbon domain containing protein [Patescibacteria group bacterium]|nr:zinc-ribbon domain containing protein [Patescibacteria group bacterium]MBU1703220.1 zinc-ribbon domain containing protein [Patescibacteria group bacterium]MBU1953749.1 zinc-ribbon domain containing protein [Patescibacteria group bacterium]
MQKTCRQCAKQFKITREDLEHLDKVSPIIGGQKQQILPPTLCQDCRRQRRLAFRNEQYIYLRKCDLCKTDIITIYSPDKPLPVYCSKCWWGDDWDPLECGRNFDFSRPFFDQFKELSAKVPVPPNMVFSSENCEYCGFCVNSRNSYLSSRVGDSEDIYYSYLAVGSQNCTDCYNIINCQLCYECIDCWNCYATVFSRLCKTTSDSAFCYDCIGCKNCFGCFGLRNAEYYFFNQKCSKEEYEKKVRALQLEKPENLERAKEMFEKFILEKPHRATIINNCQNVSGDFIVDSKDAHDCYDIEKIESAKNVWSSEYSKDIYDCDFIYGGEKCYENMSNANSNGILFSAVAITGVNDCLYSALVCNGTQNCFGCASLKKQKHCILNKQYSKEEYENLVPKIIEHMKKTGEWGEFFPATLSNFAYNETVAQSYFPLTKEQALTNGFMWKDRETQQKHAAAENLITCKTCNKQFKLVAAEIEFYKKMHLPPPAKCHDCRHAARGALRRPRRLYPRTCDKCQDPIQTTFAPTRPETVYCESCYLKEVY